MDRRALGSWLSGPSSLLDSGRRPPTPLGLPESGPGSQVGLGGRLAAFAIDTAMSLLVGLLLFRPLQSWTTSVVFVVEVLVLTSFGGASAGQRVLGHRVVRPDAGRASGVDRTTGGPASIPQVIVRTLLLALVVPALVPGPDGRPWHDRLAGTVLVRTR